MKPGGTKSQDLIGTKQPIRRPTKRTREFQLNSRFNASRQHATGSPALFLVHDGFGEMLFYRSLASLLSPEIAVYGLYPVAVDGVVIAQTRIEDIAAAYVDRIRAIQPNGPYLLGGLCGGGVIAFEIARQLQRDHETIGMLALMDSREVSARKRFLHFALSHLRRNKHDPDASAGFVERLLTFASDVAYLILRSFVARTSRLHAHFKGAVLRYCLANGRRPPKFVLNMSVEQIYLFAESSYRGHGKLRGNVLLFRAKSGNGEPEDEPFKNLFVDPLFGWAPHVQGEVRSVDVAGGHYSMLEGANAQVIADEIQAQIDLLIPHRESPQTSMH